MERDIGKEILEALNEVHQHVKGESDLTITHVDLDIPNTKELRARLGLTQVEFAYLLGISVHTLRCWEQGRRIPEGPARALLRIVDREPEAALRALNPGIS